MFEVFGSWVDCKKSQISAGINSLIFDAKLNMMDAKCKRYSKKKTNDSKDKSSTYDKKNEKESTETEKKYALPEPKKNGIKPVEPKKADLAEEEHPTDDGGEFDTSKEPKEPSKDFVDLKNLDCKDLLNVVYQVCLENAGELLKYTVSDEDNLSKEETEKKNEEFDKILLPILAKEITGLNDISGIDLKQLDEDLNNKLGTGALAGSIQSAFTMFLSNNISYGKTLNLANNSPMEIVGDESAATVDDSNISKVAEGTAETNKPEENKENTSTKSSTVRRSNSRRKK